MKINILFSVSLYLILMISCTNNESSTVDKTAKLSEEKINTRELGQIPVDINYQSDINKVQGNNNASISLLKEYKSSYGSFDFYNNLFELTSYDLFQSESFSKLGKEDLKFLLQEMQEVESNMMNIKNIPILFNAAFEKGVLTNEEFEDAAFKIISKNENEIASINWKNTAIQREKLAEIEKIKTNLYYKRSRY